MFARRIASRPAGENPLPAARRAAVALAGVPLLDEQAIAGESLPCVVRDGSSGGLDDQSAPAQSGRGAVLLRRLPVRPVDVQAEMAKATAALMTQQPIAILVEHAVLAVVVLFADLHSDMVARRRERRPEPLSGPH